ncbi:F-box protein At5g07610-like [Rutidosis leptorrhynchoides]|uniref:F-box protein At5g07610-like n=1 Tax=Rutidosis leptorrhynchoides TaxID=125765 RepID=UPI003A9A0B38
MSWLRVSVMGESGEEMESESSCVTDLAVVLGKNYAMVENVISLLLFKSVSKRWYSIITNPDFTLCHRSTNPKLDPASGFYFRPFRCGLYEFVYEFVPLYIRIPVIRSPQTCERKVVIIQSCNGLFLCYGTHNYYVYNPTTNLFKELPPCPISNDFMKMAYDPTKSPHYKLVCATQTQIYTYSSGTGIWSNCVHRYYWYISSSDFNLLAYGIYWSNAIHWLDGSNHKKLCLGYREAITSVQAPGMHGCNRKLFESRGCLLLVCDFSHLHGELNVYEMSTGHSKWLIKYIVRLDEAMRSFPEFWVYPYKQVSTDVCCIVLGEREEDSFMVINIDGTDMLYNMMSNTLCKLPYFKKAYYHSPLSSQFIEYFAGV